MRINTYVLILCIFIPALIVCSCRGIKNEDEILKKIDKYAGAGTLQQFDYLSGVGTWLSPETEYKYVHGGDHSDGIIGIYNHNYLLRDERLYFTINSGVSDKTSGQPMWAYISLQTGEKHYLCPDPLCRHTEEDGCRYLDMQSLTADPDNRSMFCVLKTTETENGPHAAICSVDLNNDIINELYAADNAYNSSETNIFNLYFINGGRLYFVNHHIVRTDIGDGMIDRQDETRFAYLDLATKKVKFLDTKYTDISFVLADDNFIYLYDWDRRRFFATGHNLENEREIFVYEEESQIYNIFYDENESCFYLGLFSNNMFREDDGNIKRGSIYRIDESLNYEKINMPSDMISSFSLTANYIYYTIYDPVSYGVSPQGKAAIDRTGGKMYRASRADTQNGELIFDGKGEFIINTYGSGYFVSGDYIYFDYLRLMKEGGMTWFRRAGSTARINFKENTIAWLNAD